MNESLIIQALAELRRNLALQRQIDKEYHVYRGVAKRTQYKSLRWLAEERVRQLAGM